MSDLNGKLGFYDVNDNLKEVDVFTTPIKYNPNIMYSLQYDNPAKIYLHYTTEQSVDYYQQTLPFTLYDTSEVDNLITTDNSDVPFIAMSEEEVKLTKVYNSSGTMTSLGDHTSTSGLYIVDPTNIEDAQKPLYELKNFFVYNSDSSKGTVGWHKQNTNYKIVASESGVKHLARTVPIATDETRARRKENKNYFVVNGIYFYTKYNFNAGSWQTYSYEDKKWATAGSTNPNHTLYDVLSYKDYNQAGVSLLPAGKHTGYVDGRESYYFTETAMFSYNNSKGSLTGWTKPNN